MTSEDGNEYDDIIKEEFNPTEATLRLVWVYALNQFALGNRQDCANLMRAASTSTHNTRLQDSFELCTTCADWAESQISEQSLTDVFDELADLLGQEPLPAKLWKETSEVPCADYERYVLRKLGYNGALLENRVKQTPATYIEGTRVGPESFSIKDADKCVAELEAVLAAKQSKGRVGQIFWGTGDKTLPTPAEYMARLPASVGVQFIPVVF